MCIQLKYQNIIVHLFLFVLHLGFPLTLSVLPYVCCEHMEYNVVLKGYNYNCSLKSVTPLPHPFYPVPTANPFHPISSHHHPFVTNLISFWFIMQINQKWTGTCTFPPHFLPKNPYSRLFLFFHTGNHSISIQKTVLVLFYSCSPLGGPLSDVWAYGLFPTFYNYNQYCKELFCT